MSSPKDKGSLRDVGVDDCKILHIKAQQCAIVDKLTEYYKQLIESDSYDAFYPEVQASIEEIKAVKTRLRETEKRIHHKKAGEPKSHITAARAAVQTVRERGDSVEETFEPEARASRSASAWELQIPNCIAEADDEQEPETSDADQTDDLASFIASGPMMSKLGLSTNGVAAEIAMWQEHAAVLCKQLKIDPNNMSIAERRRVYHYYLPVFYWCKAQYDTHKATSQGPVVVGISAPQGCGKTTIVESLENLFKHCNLTPASISIDDFYLTAADQSKLAKANPTNPLLQYRGNAGSHDLDLGATTLKTLRSLQSKGSKGPVPRYDKSMNKGYGDRAPESSWPQVEGPVDVILFEGWMLGFSALDDDNKAAAVHPGLLEVNKALKQYADSWDQMCDAWLVVKIGDPNWVQEWRLQAEVAMRSKGLSGMTDQQVRDFVNRFMPAYEAYLPALYASGPSTAGPGTPLLTLEVDAQRNVKSCV